MASTKRTAALVGVGRWGKNILRSLYELGVLKLVVDNSTETLAQVQQQYVDLDLENNISVALEDQSIEHLFIVTPPFTHYELAKQALEAGKHVFVEKPLCMSSKEAKELVSIAKNKKRILMVGHLLNYHPVVDTMCQQVEKGKLGELLYIHASRCNLGDIRFEENAMWNFSPHDFSIVCRLFNEKPTAIQSTGHGYVNDHVEDLSMTTMFFKNGSKAYVYASWLHPFKEQKMIVVGRQGMFVFDDTKPWEEKLSYYNEPVNFHHETPHTIKRAPEYIQVEFQEPLKEECRHFIDCANKGKQPVSNGTEGALILQICEASEKSQRNQGELVKL